MAFLHEYSDVTYPVIISFTMGLPESGCSSIHQSAQARRHVPPLSCAVALYNGGLVPSCQNIDQRIRGGTTGRRISRAGDLYPDIARPYTYMYDCLTKEIKFMT